RPMAPRKNRGGSKPADMAGRPMPMNGGVAVAAMPMPAPAFTLPSIAIAKPRALTVEVGLYILFVAAALLTRFWSLGAKALHHDESLHAYYSWVYETGGGYRHDPLMHGPFLFHANALIYLLFGDSNATSRYGPAFFGVLMVAMPWL